MNIFSYVATNDPDSAKALCNKHGFETVGVSTPEDLGICLEQLVAEVGEPAMLDVYSIHPDKDQLVQLYGGNKTFAPETKKGDCGCHKKQKSMTSYLSQISGSNSNQIQICIIAAALLLGAAIISKS